MRKPIAVDLFAGCGGLSLGLKRAGFSVRGAVEIDDVAAATFKTNHPRTKLWQSDIRRVTAPQILRSLNLSKGELDLLAGCPPCQGFSAIRRLNGKKRVRDARNDLLFDFLRMVKGLRPRTVLMENVPGLQKNYRFGWFQAELKRLGYKVTASVHDAQHFGVPQRRRRLILLASLEDAIKFAAGDDKRVTVRDAIGALPKPGTSGDPLHDITERRSARIGNLIREIPRNGGSRSSLKRRSQLKCHRQFSGFKDVYGRMSWDEVAPTITGGCFNPSKGRFLHPSQNRAITLREAALLQGFPVTYRFPTNRGKETVALLIGNALPPEFVFRQALQIRHSLRKGDSQL